MAREGFVREIAMIAEEPFSVPRADVLEEHHAFRIADEIQSAVPVPVDETELAPSAKTPVWNWRRAK